MAKSKSRKASRTGRDSRPQYLGVKLYSGQKVKTGQIIVRQRGVKILPGKNVKKGRDDTLYSAKDGIVNYVTKRIGRFDNKQRRAKIVNVNPQ